MSGTLVSRLATLYRLLGHRERETQQHLASLRLAQAEESAALAVETELRELSEAAVAARRQLGQRAAGAHDYTLADDWGESLAVRLGQARLGLQRALVEVRRVQALVNRARMRERQLQNLIEKLEAQSADHARRVERRSDDELAQAMGQRRLRSR